ncbi:MAG: glutathione S-transferase family protein [Hydrococcus sp. RM1_1_31]|nr:glutathione S-transferase family protein [Hydrococcus sp. RM1_1_31]
MLKFYHSLLSPIARRVWITLLEKNLSFEPILVNLDGEQFEAEFLALNPFHHIPVIVDDGFRVIESLAILDYLESKYPIPKLLPDEPKRLATVRMVQMIIIHELATQVIPLICEEEDSPELIKTKRKIDRVLNFLSELMGEDDYFGGKQLSLADIVAGNSAILLSKLEIDFSNYYNLTQWCDRLRQREAWQKTQPNAEELEIFKQRVKMLIRKKKGEMKAKGKKINSLFRESFLNSSLGS